MLCRRVTRGQPPKEVIAGFRVHRVYRGILSPLPGSSYLPGQLGTSRTGNRYETLYRLYLVTVHPFLVGLKASKLIRDLGIDIILERESSLGAGAIASLITGRPLVLEVIGPRVSLLSLNLSKRILAYTESALPARKEIREKIVKVSAAADTDRFKPDVESGRRVRNRLGLQSAQVACYAGSFAPWHGVEDLVMAAKSILDNRPNVRFLLVGPYFALCKALAFRLGIAYAFIFTGPVPYEEIPNYLNAADVLVAPFNPSKSQIMSAGFLFSPLKIFEYMACEKPIVTTSVPIVSEVIRDGIDGITVPPAQPLELAQALLRLLDSPQLALNMAKSARTKVVNSYSFQEFAYQLSRLLANVAQMGTESSSKPFNKDC